MTSPDGRLSAGASCLANNASRTHVKNGVAEGGDQCANARMTINFFAAESVEARNARGFENGLAAEPVSFRSATYPMGKKTLGNDVVATEPMLRAPIWGGSKRRNQ